jgi:hypothetical protein
VGARLAQLTYAASLAEGTLTVFVDDKVWQTQLESLKPQILAKMRKVTGGGLVADIRFRVMPVRRGPGIATDPVRDAASEIADPLLRRSFRRKQA